MLTQCKFRNIDSLTLSTQIHYQEKQNKVNTNAWKLWVLGRFKICSFLKKTIGILGCRSQQCSHTIIAPCQALQFHLWSSDYWSPCRSEVHLDDLHWLECRLELQPRQHTIIVEILLRELLVLAQDWLCNFENTQTNLDQEILFYYNGLLFSFTKNNPKFGWGV